MSQKKYPITLSDAWVEACERLWFLCEKYNRNIEETTLWDAFRLLYLDSVPDNLIAGRKAKGVF